MKLKALEMQLERIAGFDHPRVDLEQYVTPAAVAARLLHHAYLRSDIGGKRVCDLGCGTGILCCGASLLGASAAAGIDIDPAAVAAAQRNATALGVSVQTMVGDIRDPGALSSICPCDTVVMNPPFGAQKRHADRPFIDAALSCAGVVYGIFNEGSRAFLSGYIRGRGEIDEVTACAFPMRRTFAHHTRDRVEIPVEVVRILRVG
ncbi:MAG TPA: methyltransferase domain-containing protein [Methanoculleus sp.]|nr:methyltransferase domain-containing protein [Methanoculleus sp.]